VEEIGFTLRHLTFGAVSVGFEEGEGLGCEIDGGVGLRGSGMYREVAGVANLVETAKHGIEIDSARFPQAEIVRGPSRT
jgi:hypothetical protein